MALLDLTGVTLGFAGNTVLQDVSFAIGAGAIASLIGPNGAGKTSLFNCITGFYKPQRGSIVFDGIETLRLNPWQVTRAGIARTFQNVRLFQQMSVIENVMSGQHVRSRAGAIGAALRLPSQRQEATSAVSRSRGRWLPNPSCYCWTSQPPASPRVRRPDW